MEQLHIRMLGGFSIQAGDKTVSDANNRTKKVWSLLAYLICQRGKVISQKKLISMFWGDESSNNPENVVRITFHRIRTQLDQLWPGAGKELVQYRDAGYVWNASVPVTVDAERFEELCGRKDSEPDARLVQLGEALDLYVGDFLEKQSSDVWVIPIATHYHNLYIQAALETVKLYSEKQEHGKAAAVCRQAIVSDPYHEELHQLLIRELAADGDQEGAGRVYEALAKKLFDDFGIRPSEETKAVYRQAVHSPSETSLSMDAVMEQLREKETKSGAFLCDYDYFKVLCHVESRSMERYGYASHVVLLSVDSGNGKTLSRRSINRVMEQLGEQIGMNLRRGDTYSRCSVHQYIILLPKANYENSCMVCRRVLGAFNRAHPHVTAQINFMVQPLTPGISVP